MIDNEEEKMIQITSDICKKIIPIVTDTLNEYLTDEKLTVWIKSNFTTNVIVSIISTIISGTPVDISEHILVGTYHVLMAIFHRSTQFDNIKFNPTKSSNEKMN